MSRAKLEALLAPYPWAMRERVLSYVSSVDESLPSIFSEAGVRYDRTLGDLTAFVVGVRKLWSLIDGQYAVLRHSLDLISEQGVAAVRFGASVYSRDNMAFREVQELRDSLRIILAQQELLDLMYLDLPEIVRLLSDGR